MRLRYRPITVKHRIIGIYKAMVEDHIVWAGLLNGRCPRILFSKSPWRFEETLFQYLFALSSDFPCDHPLHTVWRIPTMDELDPATLAHRYALDVPTAKRIHQTFGEVILSDVIDTNRRILHRTTYHEGGLHGKRKHLWRIPPPLWKAFVAAFMYDGELSEQTIVRIVNSWEKRGDSRYSRKLTPYARVYNKV